MLDPYAAAYLSPTSSTPHADMVEKDRYKMKIRLNIAIFSDVTVMVILLQFIIMEQESRNDAKWRRFLRTTH